MKQSSVEFVERYHDLCEVYYGRRPRAFLCPFTGEDSVGERDLCDAHIIPDRVGLWPGVTVPQRGDVDGYFGRTLDAEFELMARRGRFGIGGWIGSSRKVVFSLEREGRTRTIDGFVQGNKTPQQLLKRGRAAMYLHLEGMPHPICFALNGDENDIRQLLGERSQGYKLTISGVDPKMAMESAAWVRAAVLMLFKRSPGTLISNNLLAWIHQPFADAFRRNVQNRGQLLGLYAPFVGSVKFIARGDAPGQERLDSLTSNYFLVHTIGEKFPHTPPFAISVFVKSESGHSLAIALPWSTDPENDRTCLELYRQYQTDPTMPQTMTVACFDFESWRVFDGSPDNVEAYVDYRFTCRTDGMAES